MPRAVGAVAVWVAICWGAPASIASAQPSGAAPGRPTRFWSRLAHPEHERVDRLLRQAKQHFVWAVELSLLPGGERPRQAHLESALVRLRRAREVEPHDPDVLYWLALTLDERERRGDAGSDQDREAMAAYEQLRSVAPDHDPERVAFALGVLHTRMGDVAAAATEYQRARAAAFADDPTIVANLAEVTMLAGDVEGAVYHYEEAVDLGGGSLAHFGLGVALDRLGEHERALYHVREGVSGPLGLAALRDRGVFFEPAHEVYYYEGLGHEALVASNPDAATDHLRRAANAFRLFVREADPQAPFTERARAHVTRLEALLPRSTARRR